MKIAVGAMLCEGNSLTPVLTKFTDFDYAEGDKMLEKIAELTKAAKALCDDVEFIFMLLIVCPSPSKTPANFVVLFPIGVQLVSLLKSISFPNL